MPHVEIVKDGEDTYESIIADSGDFVCICEIVIDFDYVSEKVKECDLCGNNYCKLCMYSESMCNYCQEELQDVLEKAYKEYIDSNVVNDFNNDKEN